LTFGSRFFVTFFLSPRRFLENFDTLIFPLNAVPHCIASPLRGSLEDDFEHEGQEIGEEEVALILFFGGVVEEFVEFFGRQEPLKGGACEDGEGRFVFAVENVGVGTHSAAFSSGQGGMKNNDFLKTWEQQIK